MPERSESSDAGPSLGLRAVLLVEGASDQRALTLLARRHNRDLRADAVAVVAMRGATNTGHFLGRYGPQGRNVRIGGLYDVAEEAAIRRACASAAIGRPRTRAVRLGDNSWRTALAADHQRAGGIPAGAGELVTV